MRILFVGDIIGTTGRRVASAVIPELKKNDNIDFVIANGENSAGGFGITYKIATKFGRYGIDCITSGNHLWDKKEIIKEIDNIPNLLRPANYPDCVPGKGSQTFWDGKIGVISLLGRAFMPRVDCPFKTAKKEIETLNTKITIIDFHAEFFAEKRALAEYLDGTVSAVVGSHTHVQTADAQILPKGTAFITDAGMTGSETSVIGVIPERSVKYFTLGMPQRFDTAKGNEKLDGVVMEIDDESGKAISIEAIRIKYEPGADAASTEENED